MRGGQGLLLRVPNNQPHNLRWKFSLSHGREGMSSGLRLFRFTSGLVAAAHQLCGEFMKAPSSLFFPPLSPPRWSLLGVGVLTRFGVHHLVRVMPGRKSSPAGPRRSGRLRGRVFGSQSESRGRKRGKRGVDAACCFSHPRAEPAWYDVPRLEEDLELRRGFGASWAGRGKVMGLMEALHGPHWH